MSTCSIVSGLVRTYPSNIKINCGCRSSLWLIMIWNRGRIASPNSSYWGSITLRFKWRIIIHCCSRELDCCRWRPCFKKGKLCTKIISSALSNKFRDVKFIKLLRINLGNNLFSWLQSWEIDSSPVISVHYSPICQSNANSITSPWSTIRARTSVDCQWGVTSCLTIRKLYRFRSIMGEEGIYVLLVAHYREIYSNSSLSCRAISSLQLLWLDRK